MDTGSFIVKTSNTPLIVAGGGGGEQVIHRLGAK